MSAAKSDTKDTASELSKASAAADEVIQKAQSASGFDLPKLEDVESAQLGGAATAIAPDAPSDSKGAMEYIQKFGHVPTGWIFDPAYGLRKA